MILRKHGLRLRAKDLFPPPTALELARFKCKYPGPFMTDIEFGNMLVRIRKQCRGNPRVPLGSLLVGVRCVSSSSTTTAG